MRILVYEFFSGGGRAGRSLPSSMSREGNAMRSAVVSDLARIGDHDVVTTRDRRFPFRGPRNVDVIELSKSRRALDELIAACDAVWLIAPETNGCSEDLARRVERQNRILLSSSSGAIRRASNKAELPQLLAAAGLAHPATRTLGPRPEVQARDLGFPVVVKPSTGAGCEGVSVARTPSELRQAWTMTRRSGARGPVICQKYIRGTPASVSLIADGRRAVSLAVNAQRIVGARPCTYRGGWTPLQHPMARRAADAAERACRMFPGLRGFVGIDLVLTKSEVFVIEVNPRVTTAYLGVRAVLDGNIAAMVLNASTGFIPTPSSPTRKVVTYTCAGVL